MVGYRSAGEMFGETSLLQAGVATASICADTEAQVVCIEVRPPPTLPLLVWGQPSQRQQPSAPSKLTPPPQSRPPLCEACCIISPPAASSPPHPPTPSALQGTFLEKLFMSSPQLPGRFFCFLAAYQVLTPLPPLPAPRWVG